MDQPDKDISRLVELLSQILLGFAEQISVTGPIALNEHTRWFDYHKQVVIEI